jgi:hypothetical protein
MFYTNKMFWTKSQVYKICYNVVISEKNSNVSSNKTYLHDITEILLKVALSIIIKTQTKLLMKTTYALYVICYTMYYIVGNGEDISIGCI